jgi:hypothetical protein
MTTRWLQVLFALAVVWAVIPLPLGLSDLIVARFTPEGHPLHQVFEAALGPVVIALVTVVVAVLIRRCARGFLRLPDHVTLPAVLIRVVLFLPVALVAWFVVFAAISLILEPPPWKSDNPQHVPIIFFLGTLGPMLLTPLGAVILAWWWVRRRAGG